MYTDDESRENKSKVPTPLEYAGEFSGDFDDEYRAAVLEQIRLAKIRRAKADKAAKDKLHAEIFIITAAVLALLFVSSVIVHIGKRRQQTMTFVNTQPEDTITQTEPPPVTAPPESEAPTSEEDSSQNGEAAGHHLEQINGVTYVDGIMIVNKTYPLPADYDPGDLTPETQEAFNNMASDAWEQGIGLWIVSGYRSYSDQEYVFDGYVAERGVDETDCVSGRPGHSEHQSGLCFDVNSTDFSFSYTYEAQWIAENCANYGLIVRFPEGKEQYTGYEYEAWHLRYVGVEAAQEMKAKNLCLEEYLNVSSDYNKAADREEIISKYGEYHASFSSSDGEQ